MIKRIYKVFLLLVLYIWLVDFSISFFNSFLSSTVSNLVFIFMQFLVCSSLVFLLRDEFRVGFKKITENIKRIWIIPVFLVLDFGLQIVINNLIPTNSTNQNGLEQLIQSSSPIGVMLLSILVVLVGPVVEEIIFQYFIQKLIVKNSLLNLGINKKLTITISILVATLLFMMFHMQTWRDITNLTFLGYSDLIFFSILYSVRDDNLMYPIILHVCSNTIAFLSVLL